MKCITPELVLQVEGIIKEAGELLCSYFTKTVERNVKSDGSFATEADIASEKFLIQKLAPLIKDAGFIAEESGEKKAPVYNWVIDPLDGTTNFAQGLPYFCISVALTKNDIPLFGVIYQPLLKEYFYALQGCGAFLNGKKIAVSNRKKIDESIVIVATPYVKSKEFFKSMNSVEHKVYTFRTFGAAALDQAYCAAGRADIVMFQDLSWWDVAAGMLIIQEAGGVASTFQKGLITPQYRTFIGGNQDLRDIFLKLI
ncbi:inositol monophosphatase [Candidatus Babeliales bacterium]|nr:inositol monophosphatase [Candidatus Babeliales bacterium]